MGWGLGTRPQLRVAWPGPQHGKITHSERGQKVGGRWGGQGRFRYRGDQGTILKLWATAKTSVFRVEGRLTRSALDLEGTRRPKSYDWSCLAVRKPFRKRPGWRIPSITLREAVRYDESRL